MRRAAVEVIRYPSSAPVRGGRAVVGRRIPRAVQQRIDEGHYAAVEDAARIEDAYFLARHTLTRWVELQAQDWTATEQLMDRLVAALEQRPELASRLIEVMARRNSGAD